MRFFSEFVLLARDLHDATDLYKAESKADHDSFIIDPARLKRYLVQAEAQIDAMVDQATVSDHALNQFSERLQRLDIPINLSVERSHANIEEGRDDMNSGRDIDLNSFMEENEVGRDRLQISSPSPPRLSSSSLHKDLNILNSPQMPSISSHSQAIMSSRQLGDPLDSCLSPIPSLATVIASDFDQVPMFLRSRVTLNDVNSLLKHVAIGDQIAPSQVETELGFGSKAKALIMILQHLNRARAICSREGGLVYEITSGSTSS